ncbi:MAG: chemotaxis protein CheR [Oscillospiraceae bacterium]|jgi:chemotaxis protein methyltransferase CheR|nr:chemotaxis protein CheR [Oscillospiraceae bacterium]MDR2599945.1 chemotaxis protein CheR [Oscillospiraceae bacterium]
MQISEKDFVRLYTYIKSNFGVNLEKKKTLIEGRLTNFIVSEGFDNFTDYLDNVFADKSGAKINTLMTKLTTNYTYFMREKEHYEFMENVALPEWTQKIRDRDLRIWSSASASGEEAYTTAMVLHEWFGLKIKEWDTTILATDISTRVLEMAKAGIYPEEHFDHLPKAWKLKYFNKIGEEKYQVKDVLAKSVHFGQFNLMGNFSRFRKKFHIIFSRNVMIYFDPPTKQALAKRYHDVLEVGGYLFIGHSETLSGIQGDFVQIKPAVYQRVR